MAHGFSATMDGMVAERYASAFCDAGLAVLLYDHRNFGRSGGEPRQQIDRWLQVIGYRDAIDFATTLGEVDASRLAVWGDSLSGGCVLVVAAFDPRVTAVVTQVPACGAPPPPDPGRALLEAMAGVYASRRLGVVPTYVVDRLRALVLGLGLSKLHTEGGLSCSIVPPSSRRLGGACWSNAS